MDPIAQAQDDLRRERALSFFRQTAPWAALALILLILGVAGKEAWQAYVHHDSKRNTEKLLQAANAGDSIPALLAVAASDDGARAAMARLIAFQRMTLEEQKTGGLDVLYALRQDKKAPQEWRDFASLTLVRARIAFGAGMPEADDLLFLLEPAMKNADSPWHVPALMEASLITSEMKNDVEGAYGLIKDIDPDKQIGETGAKLVQLKSYYASFAKADAKP